ncbi:MAG: hypothetical protein ACREJ2_06525 [Planctomycetota bacterium]
METEKSSAESTSGFAGKKSDDESIYIKVPNPFRIVRGARRFFGHPVFNHFRSAQVEFMRGVRDVVDYEIKQAEKNMAETDAEFEAHHAKPAEA